MACGKGELRHEARNRNDAAAAPEAAAGDALLFTMMCIIGVPVDVHVRDGSIYTGIFHTASVHEDYAIVLKKARMIKKGNLEANVVNGTMLETLIVRSEDLVQVVAKGVVLTSNGITGYVGEDGVEAAAGSNECLDQEVVKPSKSRGTRKHKKSITHDGVQGSSLSNDAVRQEPQGASSGCSDAFKDQDQERATSDDTDPSTSAPPSNPFPLVPPESSSATTLKESKFNPGAKMFSPSVMQHRTATPPAVLNRANNAYMPGAHTMMPMATAQEVDGISSARSPVPFQIVPYDNVAFGHGGNVAAYAQPVIGPVVNRMQPAGYTGQYQNFQTGQTHVHPNPQNEAVQSAPGLYPAATRPVLTPHQVHLPEHHGNASAQALQLCIVPGIMANAPPPFVMPSPISQPIFPVLRPTSDPETNDSSSPELD